MIRRMFLGPYFGDINNDNPFIVAIPASSSNPTPYIDSDSGCFNDSSYFNGSIFPTNTGAMARKLSIARSNPNKMVTSGGGGSYIGWFSVNTYDWTRISSINSNMFGTSISDNGNAMFIGGSNSFIFYSYIYFKIFIDGWYNSACFRD